MAQVKLHDINKIYPNGFHAVKSVDLNIDDKEFMILVGPSGCGKTTTLRMIAGLEEVSSGELHIGDILVNEVSPKDRNIAMVFQNYALYPHMTVYDNMAFGLKLAKKPKSEIQARIQKAAKILAIDGLLDRKPKELSGGQRQRVALGRAIVREPEAFLMDEPLSNLDAKLRVQMRAELIKLHHDLDTTFIYVTHDQTEAMTMGSRICVMNLGEIQQVDTPRNIYNNPANLFVASFIGTPPMNFFDVTLNKDDFTLSLENITIKVPDRFIKVLKAHPEIDEVIMGVRPENVVAKEGINVLVEVTEMLGSDLNVYFKLSDKQYVMRTDANYDINIDQQIHINIEADKMHLFDKTSEKSLLNLD